MYAESKHPRETSNQHTHNTQQDLLRCANCEIEILWHPVVVQGTVYCCTGCAGGGPCNCDYSQYRSVNIAGVIHYRIGEEKGENSMPKDRPRSQ